MGKFVRKTQDLEAIVAALQSQGKKVVYASGVFDVVHVGQARALIDAKSRGHYLVVGVHDDESARSLGEAGRPFLSEKERIEFVECLEPVNYVVSVGEEDSVPEILSPDILVTGIDSSPTLAADKKAMKSGGGKVYAAGGKKGPSVAVLVKKIQSAEEAAPAAPKKAASKKTTTKKASAKKKTTAAKAGASTRKTTTRKKAAKTATAAKATAKKKTAKKKKVAKKKAAASAKPRRRTTKVRKPELVGAS